MWRRYLGGAKVLIQQREWKVMECYSEDFPMVKRCKVDILKNWELVDHLSQGCQ